MPRAPLLRPRPREPTRRFSSAPGPAPFGRVRVLLLLALLAPPLPADLIARITTDRGSLDVVLLPEVAPQAVANFITLSQGTRSRVDAVTGAVTDAPLYVGEKFFRVINQSTFRIAQTGSGAPANSGDPGFTFRDEFDPSARHTPYVLSMANSGPNTNGSQIFLTGNVSIPHLDDVHTVFGRVPDAAGRATIDEILAAGDNGSTIESVEILRTDPAAEAFDEFAQGLATVSPPQGVLTVGDEVRWEFPAPRPAGTQLSVFRSADLAAWSGLGHVVVGSDERPVIDSAALPSAFYHLGEVAYLDSPTPASLANRRLALVLPDDDGTLTFDFDATGEGGGYSYNGQAGTITGNDYSPGGYGAILVVETSGLRPLRLQLGFDEQTSSVLAGRVSINIWSGFGWDSAGVGSFELDR